MILDTLHQISTYNALLPRFEKAFAFLLQVTDQTPVGRHDIVGDDIFALVQRNFTTAVAERQYESHRKYVDIQYIQRGREVMYWAPLSLLKNVTMPFDLEQDAALYGLIDEGVPVQVSAGQFTVFFFEDGHIPGCAWGELAEVMKVLIKVRV